MDLRGNPRLFLLEFITPGTWYFQARYYPFLAGLARAEGIEARWACLGADFATSPDEAHGVSFAIELPAEELARLAEEVERFRPTHVLVSDPVSATVRAVLEKTGTNLIIWPNLPLPPAKDVESQGNPEESTQREWLQGRTDWFLAWLGLVPATCLHFERYLVGAAQPAYDAVLLNPLARERRPHLTIMGGVQCDYQAPLRDNPIYQDVDWSTCTFDRGCAFCGGFKGNTSEPAEDPVDVAVQQFLAIRDTALPDGRDCAIYDLYDIRLFGRIDSFFERILELHVPPGEFLFAPRLDRFLAAGPRLERVLPRLKGSGHVLRVARMGAENLVDAENDRFNKGITRAQIDDATALWQRLRREYPGTFEYDGTYAYITVSPWTTLEDLEEGIAAGIARGLAPWDGWLFTPVELRPGSPIQALARKDGLLVPRFDDPALYYEATQGAIDTSSMTPWRFRDERAGLAFGLMVRGYAAATRGQRSDVVLRADETYRWLVNELARRSLAFDRPDLLAQALVAEIKTSPPPLDGRVILFRALDRLEAGIPYVVHTEKQEAFARDRQTRRASQAARARLEARLTPDPKRLPAPRRLLLVETVIREPWVFNSRFFPYVAGFARKQGVETLWLCFGAAFAFDQGGRHGVRQHIELAPEDAETVRQAVARFQPTHVMTSDLLSDALIDVLAAGPAHDRLVTWGDAGLSADARLPHVSTWIAEAPSTPTTEDEKRWGDDVTWQLARTDWLLSWLGEDRARCADFGRYLVGSARPCYDAIMANAGAGAFRPPIILAGGISCDHGARIRDNPVYRDLDWSTCAHDAGCAFCTWFKGPTSDPRANPVDAAEEQLRAVVEDALEDGRYRGVFDVHDVRLFSRVDAFFERVLQVPLPPSEFVFSPRIDRFVQAEKKLDAVLPRLARAGHVLTVYRMGGENLNEHENARLNKCITREQIDRATQLWRRYRREHPAAFRYDGTYGYITATPWTTLRDLEEGIGEALRLEFSPHDVWLYTPVELQPSSAILALAQKDGVTASAFDDPAMIYKASINNICLDLLTPWRFQDERAAAAFGLMVRYVASLQRAEFPDAVFAGDALYAWLLGRVEENRRAPVRPDWFAREVVALIGTSALPVDRREIAEKALERLAVSPVDEAVEPQERPSSQHSETPGPVEPEPLDAGLLGLLQSVTRKLVPHLAGVLVQEVRRNAAAGSLRILLQLEGVPYELLLFPAESTQGCLFRTRNFKVAHGSDTPPRSPDHLRRLRVFVEIVDRVLNRNVAEK